MAQQSKPQNYDELYPGRFLKAGLFKGKQVTLTITDVTMEGLAAAEDEDDKEEEPPSVILSFKETKKQLVIPKTNAFCLMSMFGKRLADWVDKKVVFFPTTTKMMGKMVDCIRVWGSPHIDCDMPLLIPQGLKKPLKMTMHAIKLANHPIKSIESVTINKPDPPESPEVLERWEILGWTDNERRADWDKYEGQDYLGHLSALIDQQDAQEAS